VPERREAGQGERQDPICMPTTGIGHEPDPARVVLGRWIVERWRLRDPATHGRTPP
jgi:hypothetical protein